MEYHEKALTIRQEIEDRQGAARVYGNLETCTIFLVNMAELWSTFEKALAIRQEIGDRQGEARVYGNLETCTIFLVNMAELWSTMRRHLQLD